MNIAIIAAAGQGRRVGGSRAKQFLELGGVPLVIHTLRRFEQSATIGEIILVLPPTETDYFLTLAAWHELTKPARVVAGGETRTESIWRGLQAVRTADAKVVAVHDGVRPFVSASEIDRTVRAAEESGAAILAVPATDTMKEVEQGRVARTPERGLLWHAQTPQCFRYDILRRSYERALEEHAEATDDSTLVERLGYDVSIVEGRAANIKITRPEDLALAEILLRETKSGVRS